MVIHNTKKIDKYNFKKSKKEEKCLKDGQQKGHQYMPMLGRPLVCWCLFLSVISVFNSCQS